MVVSLLGRGEVNFGDKVLAGMQRLLWRSGWRRAAGVKFVWHIHGEVEAPTTITLGCDQYSGYLQKLRTYATADRESKNGSPFKIGNMAFDHVPVTV